MPSSDRIAIVRPRFDLGLKALVPHWRALFAGDGVVRDLEQGILLAAWTLPLSLFLATLSGVPASSAIVSTAIGSAICVLFGGTHVALSGPGLSTALLASWIVHQHGVGGLGAVLIVVGLGQLGVGVLGLGRFVRLFPVPVIRGYVVAIGIVLIAGQLPLIAGATLERSATPLERIDHLFAHAPHASPIVLGIAAGSVLLSLMGLIHRRIPGPLIAVVVSTVIAILGGVDAPRVDEVRDFPMPSLPDAPSRGYASLLGKAFVLGVTMTLDTALSTVSLERTARRSEDPDQELIANGLATVAAAFLGGVATTQLIARSAIGVRLGVGGRRPALVQAFVVLGVGLAAWRLIPLVPTAALTGVAIATALPLLDPRPLREIARISRVELGLALLTSALIVLVGLIEGVVAGLALGLMIATARIARTRALLHKSRDPRAAHHLAFSGSITFLAALELEMLRVKLGALDPINGLVVDLRNVVAIDSSGADGLIAALDVIRSRDGKIALLGPSMAVREVLARADETAAHPPGIEPGSLSTAIAPNDREVDRLLGRERATLARPHLLVGLQRFRDQMREHYDSLFAHLADGQHPHTMFITCADSRVDPGLLMGSHPGDLFIVRCIGALMPPSGNDSMPQEGAALEYALGVLGVRNIVLCGHSKCGAIAALKKGDVPAELASLVAWSKHATEVAGEVASFPDVDDAVRAVTVRQLENIRSYPLVKDKLARGELQMHAWFYDLGAVELFEWDEAKKKFAVLGSEPRPTTLPPPKPADEPVELEPDNWPTRRE